MLVSKPQHGIEANSYIGRKVRKAFYAEGRKKKQYFTGTVVDCPFWHGEFCYSVEYEDGDAEDIAWEELMQIMVPDQQPAASAWKRCLYDTTNIADKHGKPGLRHTFKEQPIGMETPQTEHGPGPSDAGTAGQQPRMQREDRTRKRHLEDGDIEQGDHKSNGSAEGRWRTRQCDRILEDPEAEVDGAKAERPKKRRLEQQPAAEEAGDEHLQVPLEPAEVKDGSGFTARKTGLAGQIAKIRVENFMCHRHFELEFGTHVTLVSGANGSGKSAVVQALQVCLGVTARNTGRGTAIADLIRAGVPDAKVQVTMWNTGDDAFMPSVFGDRITVERHLKRVGASTYALLDAHGRKAALERGERVKDVLDRMLDHFTVDANNPLTIITQDKSRSLLQDKSNAKDKYEMFMAGTLLDRVQDDLKVANAQVNAMTQNHDETLARYNAEKQEEHQLKSKVEKLRSADKYLQDRDMLEKAIAWRAVQQMDERLAAAKAIADDRGPELLSAYDRHVQALARAKQELQDRQQDLEAQMQRHKEIMDSHNAHVQALIKAEKESRVAMDRAKRSTLSAQNNLDTLRGDKQALDDELAKETDGKAAEARRLVEEHQKQVTAKQVDLNEAVAALNGAAQAIETARAELAELQKQEEAARGNVRHQAKMVADFQKKLRELDGFAQGDRLGMFNAGSLNNLINQNIRRFQERPIGPIGALLTVTDSKWLVATEVALGNIFRDYLVSCSTDAMLLWDLMRQAGYQRASVVTTNFAAPAHNIPPARRPANGFVPLLDVLVVQDPAARGPVLNYLVDKARVETAALVENERQGMSVNHGGAAGQHITAAIDLKGNWYKRNERLKWQDRNERVKESNCRLIADVSEYKTALGHDLDRAEAQLGAHREHCAALSGRLKEARDHEAQCSAEWRTASHLKARANTELSRLLAQAPEMPRFEDDEAAGTVLTQLASIQNELAQSQIQLQTAQEAFALAEQSHRQAVEQAKAARERYEEQVGEGQRLRQQQTQAAVQMVDIDGVRAAAIVKKQQIAANLTKLRGGVQVAEAQLQQALAAAEQVCSRDEGEEAIRLALEHVTTAVANKLQRQRQRDRQVAIMSEDELQGLNEQSVKAYMEYSGLGKLLAGVNKDIANAEAEAGCSDLQELEIRLAAQSRTVATRLRAYKRMHEMVQRFQSSYINQMQSFERLRTSLMDITQAKFAKYLRRRDHDGRLDFNHAERTLKLLVKPKGKNNRDAQAVEDLKQLSGGERSFTTVALLLAIGENTECPFRCNDEFDVFMDEVNRRVATETLLEFAMEHSAFQYVFLTPQDIQTVEDARQQLMKRRRIELPPTFLRTVKMHPPRENVVQA